NDNAIWEQIEKDLKEFRVGRLLCVEWPILFHGIGTPLSLSSTFTGWSCSAILNDSRNPE
ncbi:MAG: hypothetical protein P8130_09840, partial [Deltaproteobacteria bacterium]